MNHKINRIVYSGVSFVALVALACTCGNIGTPPSPTPAPTHVPTATKQPIVEPTAKAIPTKPSIGSNSGDGSITLSADPFTYSNGAFSINFPEGWKVTDYDHGAFSASPDGVAAVGVVFENVGTTLDTDALNNYIVNSEASRYSAYPNYLQSSTKKQSDGSIAVFKTLDNKGVPFNVATYYWQDSTTMFAQDWWVSSADYDALSQGLVDVSNSMKWDGSVAEQETIYFHRYQFSCPDNVCEFSVPYGWSHLHSDKDGIAADDFISPLLDGRIQYFTYTSANGINSDKVDGLAKLALQSLTGATDVTISEEKPQSDGSIRLIWNTVSGGFSGMSFYEAHDTKFNMWSLKVNSDSLATYTPLWNEIVASYKIP